MARWSWSPLASALVVALFVSGCIDFGGDELGAFGTVDAPEWSPGHTWTWDVAEEGRYTESGSEGTHTSSGSSNSTITHSVVGSADLSAGQGWVVQRDGEADEAVGGPLFQTDGLALVPAGTIEAVAMSYSYGPCTGPESVMWHEAHNDGPSPAVSFPVKQGDTWSGEDGFVAWKAEALGMSSVRVPAGSFEAVVVAFSAQVAPNEPETSPAEDSYESDGWDVEPFITEFSFSMKVWYAPAVENVVRVETHYKMMAEEDGEGSFSMEMSGVMKLLEFDLATTEGEAYPPYVDTRDPWDFPRMPAVQIVSDTEFPLNAATTNRTVTFGLMEQNGTSEELPVVDTVEPYALGDDFEGYTIRWTMNGPGMPGPWNRATHYGPTFTTEMPPGGWYEIRAELWYGPPQPEPVPVLRAVADETAPMPASAPVAIRVQPGCAPMVRHFGMYLDFAPAQVVWSDTYQAEYAAGPTGRINLGTFDAVQSGWVMIDEQMTTVVPVLYDDTQAILVSPSGEEHPINEGDSFFVEESGTWLLDWDVRGVTGQFGVDTLALGHTVRVDLVVDY